MIAQIIPSYSQSMFYDNSCLTVRPDSSFNVSPNPNRITSMTPLRYSSTTPLYGNDDCNLKTYTEYLGCNCGLLHTCHPLEGGGILFSNNHRFDLTAIDQISPVYTRAYMPHVA